jgi:hypothetical protein
LYPRKSIKYSKKNPHINPIGIIISMISPS